MGNRGSYPKNLAALIKIGAMGLAYPSVRLYQSEQKKTQEPPIDLPPSSIYDETPAEVTVEELSAGKETNSPGVHRRGPNKPERSKLANC